MLRNLFISHEIVGAHDAVEQGRERLADYYLLAKPEITLLGVLTALCGGYLALRGTGNYYPLIHILIGTSLAGAGAGALNEYAEREYDALMKRTMRRPLVTGAISPAHALRFGLVMSFCAVLYLAATTTILAAGLGALTVASYVLIYTPLKRRTPFAIVIGGIPGALPPLIGWAAACGELTAAAMSLYFILFFWQMPHFLALAWMYRKDYERAGYRMLTVVDPTGTLAGRQILIYTAALLPASLAPTLVGLTGIIYFWGALVLSTAFLLVALNVLLNRSNANARKLFIASLIYLPTLFLLLMIV